MALSHILYEVLKERWKSSFRIPPGGEKRMETWEAREETFMFFLMPVWRNPVAYACLLPLSYLVTREVQSALSLIMAITLYAPYARRDAEKLIPVLCGVWIGLSLDLRHLGVMLGRRENWVKVLMMLLHHIKKGLIRVRRSQVEFGFVLLYWAMSGSGWLSALSWMLLSDRYLPCSNLLRRELWRYVVAASIVWGSTCLFILGFAIMACVPATPPGAWSMLAIGWGSRAASWIRKTLRNQLGLAWLAPVGTIELALDEEVREEGYVEPWLDQVRDTAHAAGRTLLLAYLAWSLTPGLLLWFIGLLFEGPEPGLEGKIGLGDGEYVIVHRFLTVAYARTAGFVYRGTLHAVAHTGITGLRYGGRYYTPTFMSVSADVVTWGGLPAFQLHEAGDKILVASVTSGLFDNEVELLPAVQHRVGSSVSYAREDGEDCMTGSPVFAFSQERERHYPIGLIGQLFEGDGASTNQGIMNWVEESANQPWLWTIWVDMTCHVCTSGDPSWASCAPPGDDTTSGLPESRGC